MDTLLVGTELEDALVSEVCGSRLDELVVVVVVPSEETVLIRRAETLEGSVWCIVRIRFA